MANINLIKRIPTGRKLTFSEVDGNWTDIENFINNLVLLPEAPEDGKQYGRQNKAWTEIIHTGLKKVSTDEVTLSGDGTAQNPLSVVGGTGGGTGGINISETEVLTGDTFFGQPIWTRYIPGYNVYDTTPHGVLVIGVEEVFFDDYNDVQGRVYKYVKLDGYGYGSGESGDSPGGGDVYLPDLIKTTLVPFPDELELKIVDTSMYQTNPPLIYGLEGNSFYMYNHYATDPFSGTM